jgi:hypothetical protein
LRAVADLIVVLRRDDELSPGQMRCRRAVLASAVLRVDATVVPTGAQSGDQRVERVDHRRAEVLVVARRFARQRDVQRVMEVVRPGRGKAVSATLHRLDEPRQVQVAFRDDVDRAAGLARFTLDGVVQLAQKVDARFVDDSMNRVQPQAVESASRARHPAQRVLDHEPAHRSGVGAVVVDRVPPGRLVARGEVGAEFAEVVPFRPDVIVDDVQKRAEPLRVSCLDQPRESARTAVRRMRREQIDAVVAPVARAWKCGDGHDLDGGVAGFAELAQMVRGAGGGSFARKRPEVDLAKNETLERQLRAA